MSCEISAKYITSIFECYFLQIDREGQGPLKGIILEKKKAAEKSEWTVYFTRIEFST